MGILDSIEKIIQNCILYNLQHKSCKNIEKRKKIVHYRQKKWYKKKMRNHWRIENSLHHVLDELFHEDRSAARNSKNNMAVLRKFAYNILRLTIMAKKQEPGPTEMRDEFSDNLTLVETYVFREVAHL